MKSGWSVQRARLRIVQHKWKSGQGQGQEPVKDLSLDKSLSPAGESHRRTDQKPDVSGKKCICSVWRV